MSATPTVSVVITCFNYGRYLDACLQSVLGQTHPDLDVLVVNDGSTDDTAQVVRRRAGDPRLRYLERENSGQARAKNAGIQHTAGELVAFLDADDCWQAEKLARQLPLFGDPRVGVVYARQRFVGPEGEDNGFVQRGEYLQPRRGEVAPYLLFDNFVPFSSAIVRRSCLEAVGGFDESLAMAIDWDLWLRLALDWRFDYVDAPLIAYRMGHADQMSRQRATRLECCERITRSFLAHQEGRLPPRVVRDALAYTYVNRGRHLEASDRPRALAYYLRALGRRPLHVPAYKGLVRTMLAPGRG